MTKSLGIFDAKTQFSRIVQDAQNGRDTIITRHGRPVAKVTPAEPAFDREKVKAAVRGLRALKERLRARGVRVTPEEIKAWVNEGRP